MNNDKAINYAIGFFLVILLGALFSALLGGVFAILLVLISPEFVSSMFGWGAINIIRYAFAMGMVWGLFIGASVSGFACFLAVIIKVTKVFIGTKMNTQISE